ncbi:MAG: DUF4124 domain-containing protein [Comamonas sp.]|nr:DUF4124 domain-containing protein [Comamonas sp.]
MRRCFTAALIAMACTMAYGQVYRCDQGGKTVYTDAPCLGAKKIDATPSQGFDTYSGKSQKGKEVRKDERRRLMTESMRPLHGQTYEAMKPRYERSERHLTPAEHAQCEALDKTMEALEEREKRATGDTLKAVQLRLLRQRQRYRELKC